MGWTPRLMRPWHSNSRRPIRLVADAPIREAKPAGFYQASIQDIHHLGIFEQSWFGGHPSAWPRSPGPQNAS